MLRGHPAAALIPRPPCAASGAVMRVVVLLSCLLLGRCDASVVGPIESLKEKGPQDTAPQGHPDSSLSDLGEAIVTAMHDLLARQERSINDRLKQLEVYVDRACGSSHVQNTNLNMNNVGATVSTVLDRFMGQMSSLAQTFADDLRQEFRAEAQQVLKKMQEQTAALATKSDLREVGIRVCADAKKEDSKTTGKSGGVLNEGLESVNHRLATILTLLGNVSSVDVLHYTRRISRSLETLEPLYHDLVKVVKTCGPREEELRNVGHLGALLEQLTEEVDENGNALSGMTLALEDAEHMLAERLQTLEDLTQQLTDNMALPSADMTPPESYSTTTPGAVSDCLDSQFVGVQAAGDLCGTAVRYNKCSLQIVAYHCCRSCTDACQIPDMGPHRFLHYPRRVNLFLGN